MLRVYGAVMWFSIFFFKQKTAYEMRISDWSSDVCSSDLPVGLRNDNVVARHKAHGVAVANGCGIASAATRAACAAARTAGTTCSARTTRATSGLVGRRRFTIPMHAIERVRTRMVLLAVESGRATVRGRVCKVE